MLRVVYTWWGLRSTGWQYPLWPLSCRSRQRLCSTAWRSSYRYLFHRVWNNLQDRGSSEPSWDCCSCLLVRISFFSSVLCTALHVVLISVTDCMCGEGYTQRDTETDSFNYSIGLINSAAHARHLQTTQNTWHVPHSPHSSDGFVHEILYYRLNIIVQAEYYNTGWIL